MKKGYEFQPASKQKVDLYEFEFKYFKKSDTGKIVAIFILAKSSFSGLNYYLAILFNNVELLNKYYESLNLLDKRMTKALTLATSSFITYNVSKWN